MSVAQRTAFQRLPQHGPQLGQNSFACDPRWRQATVVGHAHHLPRRATAKIARIRSNPTSRNDRPARGCRFAPRSHFYIPIYDLSMARPRRSSQISSNDVSRMYRRGTASPQPLRTVSLRRAWPHARLGLLVSSVANHDQESGSHALDASSIATVHARDTADVAMAVGSRVVGNPPSQRSSLSGRPQPSPPAHHSRQQSPRPLTDRAIDDSVPVSCAPSTRWQL